MEQTKIEWTATRLPDGSTIPGYTANFWWGCQKVSPACHHCYAETWAKRMGKEVWGPTAGREYKKAIWKELPKWNTAAAKAGYRPKVFTQSMSDMFEDHSALSEWRTQALDLIAQCSNMDFLMLTKRPENIMAMVPESWRDNWPDHVWAGTTVENQQYADERIPHLLKVPAAVRFLSCEPLLGPVDLRGFEYPYQIADRGLRHGHDWLTGEEWQHSSIFGGGSSFLDADDKDSYGEKRIHWVIVGGESGHNARPSHPNWFRSLRNQCEGAGIPYFFKQWGEWADMKAAQIASDGPLADGHGNVDNWLRRKVIFANGTSVVVSAYSWTGHATDLMYKVGKKAAGRLLDGVEYSQFPA